MSVSEKTLLAGTRRRVLAQRFKAVFPFSARTDIPAPAILRLLRGSIGEDEAALELLTAVAVYWKETPEPMALAYELIVRLAMIAKRLEKEVDMRMGRPLCFEEALAKLAQTYTSWETGGADCVAFADALAAFEASPNNSLLLHAASVEDVFMHLHRELIILAALGEEHA